MFISFSPCWWGCGEKGTLVHCCWKYNLVDPLWIITQRFLKKLKIELPCVHAQSLKSCPTLCSPMDCHLPVLCPWDSPGMNTGVGCRVLLQGIFPDPGIKSISLALQVDSLPTEARGTCRATMHACLLSDFSHVQLFVTLSPPGSSVRGILYPELP